MTVKPTVSLNFDGRCDEALELYKRCLGAVVSFRMTWGESPMAKDAPPEWGGKIVHASFMIGDMRFACADAHPGAYVAPRGISILLGVSALDEADRIFRELGEGGRVTVPLQETFWALRFGGVVDRFGIAWEINCEKPQ